MTTSILTVERNRVTDTLPSHTSFGSYPVVYYTWAGDLLCPTCTTEALDNLIDADQRASMGSDDPQYMDILWEGIEFCCDCGTGIRGAYEEEEE